jgi:hypothetical protein
MISHNMPIAGRIELAVCILGPLLVLAGVTVPGRLYCRHWDENLKARSTWLERLPEMEAHVEQARRTLLLFGTHDPAADRGSELTLAANKAAKVQGVVLRSVNVDRQQPGDGSDGLMDYRVTLSGEAALSSIIAMLDALERPPERCRVAHVTLRSRGGQPEETYEGDMVLVARTVAAGASSSTASDAPAPTWSQIDGLGDRLRSAGISIRAWAGEQRPPLKLEGLLNRKAPVAIAAPVEGVSLPLSIKLSGVIWGGKRPLAITDRGVFGVGDEVGGYTIGAIAEDHVELTDRRGRREKVSLYGD